MDYSELKKLTDEQLVLAAAGGEREAENILCTRYAGMAVRKARPFFLVGAEHKDLVQEGMIGLFKAIRDYSASAGVPFAAFAELCVRRQILTAVKASTRNKHRPLNSSLSLQSPVFQEDDDHTFIDIYPSAVDNPEDSLINRETLEDILRGIDEALSPLERRVLKLYLEGRSYRDIAELLDCSQKSVDNALQRVKRKLAPKIDTD